MNFKRIAALALLLAIVTATPAMAATMRAKQVISVALTQLGKPYKLNSDAPNSFNCASFVTYCCNQVSSGTISKSGIKGSYYRVASKSKMDVGDLVCFKTTGNEVGILSYHFGIYMGHGYFIHASNSAGKVIVSKLKDYAGRYLGALRVF